MAITNKQALHLFEFDLDNNGTPETYYYTDNDIFITYNENLYTPIDISFDKISLDFSLKADGVSVAMGNIGQALITDALTKDWRNKEARIYRIDYSEGATSIPTALEDNLYPNNTGDDEQLFPNNTGDDEQLFPYEKANSYDIGVFSFDNGYPSMDFGSEHHELEGVKLLFKGILDNFRATPKSLSVTITNVLNVWNRPYPAKTYDKGEYATIISSMVDKLLWK